MPPKQKRQIRKPPRPPKPSTPDLDVFAFYQDFVSKERPGLSRIYSDEDLKELAVVGAKLIRTLSEDGCGSEDARLLSLLVLYDVSIFIDDPKAAGGGGDEELLSGVVETLELLTKVIDLSNPGHRFATIEFSNRSLFDKYREQCPLLCGNFNGCVEYPRSCGFFCGWVYSLTDYPAGYSPGLFKRPLLRITVIGHVCSNTRNYIEGIIDVGLDLWRAGGHEDCLVLQFGYIGNDKKPIDLFRTLNTFSERSVGCMLEGDRLEDITGRKWELLRKLLVGAVMPSNRYLDHRLATDFNYNESYVVHTTHKRNPKSAGLGSSLVKTRWTHVREIGDGAFGTVTLQRSDKKEQPRLRAVKFIHRCDEQFKEVKALCRVMDRNDLFVAFLGWYKDKNSNGVHIAMEYIKHGDLSWWLQDGEVVDEATTREITIQVLTGLEVLHSRHICHRDLKPQNILIASLNPLKVKIADFGASKDTSQTALKTRIGTDGYLAPELLGLIKDVKNPGTYTFVIDIWSLGCLIYQMLTSVGPFTIQGTTGTTSTTSDCDSGFVSDAGSICKPETDISLFDKFCNSVIPLPMEMLNVWKVSEDAKRFIQEVLQAHPSLRPSAAKCIYLIHDWLPVEKVGAFEIETSSDDELAEDSMTMRRTMRRTSQMMIRSSIQTQMPSMSTSIIMGIDLPQRCLDAFRW